MRNKICSALSQSVFSVMCVLGLSASLGAARHPSESLFFGPGSGREPRTNGDLQSTAQVVGYITVAGQKHHALFTVIGQSPTYGMDLLVFDIDAKTLVKRFQIPDVAGSAALAFGGDQLFFSTVDRPKLFKYDTTAVNSPPVLLADIPFSASDSIKGNGYAFGTIIGPDQSQAIQMRDGITISTAIFKAVYLTGTYTGHLYRYTASLGLEDLGKINEVEQYGRFTRRWKRYIAIGTGVVNPSITVYDIAAGSFLKTTDGKTIHAIPPALIGRTDLEYARPNRQRYTPESDPYVYVTFDGQPGAFYRLDIAGMASGQMPSEYWNGPLSTPPSMGTDLFYPEVSGGISVARILRDPPTQVDYLEINYVRGVSLDSLGYDGGPVRFAATTNKEDEFYFSSYLPGYLYGGNLASGAFTNRYPYSIGGESYSLLIRDLADGRHVLFSGNYSGSSPLGLTDLADPTKIKNIVFGGDIRNDWRPHAMVEDSQGMIFMGAQPGYGQRNGYIVRFNPESTLTQSGGVYSYADSQILSLPDQSATCLFPYDPLHVGGTMIQTGAGTDPIADSAQLFLYCGQDTGVCEGKRGTIINTINLKDLPNRDNTTQLLKVTKVFSIAALGDGKFTAAVQYVSGSGFLCFEIDSSDPSHLSIRIKETAQLPAYLLDGKSELWNPSTFVTVQGNLYAGSTSRIYLVSLNGNRITYTPVFNTSYHRLDIGGLLFDKGNLFYSAMDNVYKLGPIPTGPWMAPPLVTARTYGTVTLTWPPASEVDGIVRYDLERRQRTKDSFTLIGSTRATTYKDVGLTPGTDYEYRVRAVDEGALQTPLGIFNTQSVYSPPVTGGTLELPAFTDNFDSEPTGSAPARWDNHSDGGTRTTIDAAVSHGRIGKSLQLLDESGGSYAQVQHFSGGAMDSVYFKASVRFKDKNQLSYVFHGNGDKTSLWFLMGDNGQWTYSNGATTFRFPDDTVGFEAGRWYDVEVAADFSKGTYGAWVNGQSIGQGIPIPSGNTSLAGFRILPAGTPGVGGLWVDDIYFAAKRPDHDLLAPRLLSVQAQNVTDHSVTIAWQTDEPSDTVVKWGETPALEKSPISIPEGETNHSCSLNGLGSGTKYYFQVQSKDDQGNNAESDILSVDTLAVPAPVSIITPRYNTNFTTAQTVSITADVQGIPTQVEFYDGATLKHTTFAAPYTMDWVINASENGVHAWTAKAVEAGSGTKTSAIIRLVVAIDTQAPSVPLEFTATGKARSLDLTWEASEDAGASGLAGYRVDVSADIGFSSYLPGWQNRFLGIVTSTTVSDLSDATVYFARIRAADKAGNISVNSFNVRAKTLDTVPPTVLITNPTEKHIYPMPQTVTVTADATDNVGVTKVCFFRNGVAVSTVTSAPYEYAWTVSDTDNGMFTWTAMAFDAAGNSARTDPVLVTVSMDTQAPTPPSGLIPAGLVRAMDLAWTASSDSGGSGMKGYRLDVSTESTFGSFLPGWENQFLGLVVSTRVAGLEADTVYYARLRAQDNRGNLSADSATVSSRTSVLKAEIPLTDGWLWSRGTLSKAGDTWTYAESTENGGHYVYKRTTSGISTSDYAQFSVLVKATASPARDVEIMLYNTDVSSNRATARCTLSGEGAVSTVIGGESTGVTGSISAKGEGWYLCNVLAKLDSRNGSNLTFLIWGKSGGNTSYVGDPAAGFQFKNPLITILPADTTPPTIPTLSAVGGSHSLGLSWTTSTDTGGSGLARYRVDVALDAGFTTFVAGWQNRDVGVLTSATVTGLGDYTNYSVRVRAEDNASNSSGFSNAVTTRTLDTLAPTISLSTPTAGTTYTTPQSVLVKATATDAVGVTKVWFILNDVVVSTDTVSPYQYSWAITGANNGAHAWKSTAFDAMGNSSTTVAVPVTVNIDILPPSTPVLQSPTELSATSGRLNWSAATDNVRVIGYRLYRDTFLIATIGGEETSFLDSGLAPETLYKYTLAAFDDMGNTSAMSPELSVTTPRRALLAPRGSLSGVSPQSVGIRWASVEGANRYTLAASLSVTSGHEFSLQREIPASEASDNESISGLSPNTTYYLYLNACNESDCTDFVLLGSAVTHALAPALTAAEGKGKEVRLTINANGNPAGTKYRIERSRGGGEFALATTVTSLSPVMGDLAPGERYTFRVKAENHAGVTTEPSNTLSATIAPETVEGARAYPVPFRPGIGAEGITFDRIPEGSSVKIYTVDGRPVKTLSTDTAGEALWTLDNEEGSSVVSGVYMAVIEKAGARKKIKVVVQN
jgi:chitodextrinase